MMKRFLASLLSIGMVSALITMPVFGAGEVVTAVNFGGGSDDYFYSIAAAEDGGYVAAGFSESFGSGDWSGMNGNGNTDAIIVKYDDKGSIEWKRSFGGSSNDQFKSIAAAEDGGYIAAGYSTGFGSGDWSDVSGKGYDDAIIVKYDAEGNVEWKRSFGGGSSDWFYSIAAAADGGYVAAGYSYSDSFGNGEWSGVSGKGGVDAIIVKYDAEGNIKWKKSFGGNAEDYFNSVSAAKNGGYVAAGLSFNGSFGNGDWSGVSGNGPWDAIIVKYNAEGNVEWKGKFGGEQDVFYSIAATADSGYVAVGSSYGFGSGDWSGVSGNGGTDAIIVKYGAEGNIEWKKNFGGSDSDYFNSIAAAADGGYIAAGYSTGFGSGDWSGVSGNGNTDAIIVKYDAEGNIEWKRYFGGNGRDWFISIAAASDGGYAAAGQSYADSFGSGDWSGVSGKGKSDATIVKFVPVDEPTPTPEEPAATERSYAFTKTIAEFGDTITVTVKGYDSVGSFTAENTIDKTTKFSGMGELQLGIILKVPEGMTVTSVTIK